MVVETFWGGEGGTNGHTGSSIEMAQERRLSPEKECLSVNGMFFLQFKIETCSSTPQPVCQLSQSMYCAHSSGPNWVAAADILLFD